MKVKMRKLDTIKPYSGNPRVHTATIEALKQSIKRYGFNVPLIIDKNNVIITGHARYKALRELEISTVPCVTVDLTPKEAKEFRIVDNKISELSSWDTEVLKYEMREFDEMIGFNDEEFKDLIFKEEDLEFESYDDDDFKKIERELNRKFDNVSNDAEKGRVEVICPHCGTEFQLVKSDIIREAEKS